MSDIKKEVAALKRIAWFHKEEETVTNSEPATGSELFYLVLTRPCYAGEKIMTIASPTYLRERGRIGALSEACSRQVWSAKLISADDYTACYIYQLVYRLK